MKYLLTLLTFLFSQFALAQLVVDVADFASNTSKYNGRTIVLRGVTISKTSANSLSLSGPQTTSAQTPTSGNNPSGGAIMAGSATLTAPSNPQPVTVNATSSSTGPSIASPTNASSRSPICTPPRNWEMLNVEIPNYTGCFTIYKNMAKSIVSGRKLNADITIFVDTNLMHRIARVKIN